LVRQATRRRQARKRRSRVTRYACVPSLLAYAAYVVRQLLAFCRLAGGVPLPQAEVRKASGTRSRMPG